MQDLHVLLSFILLQHSSNSIYLFNENVCLFNSVGHSAGKSAAGLLIVMLACLRGMLVSNLHRRDLAVRYSARSVRLSRSLRLGREKMTGATEAK